MTWMKDQNNNINCDKAYKQGLFAHQKNLKVGDNPYHEDTLCHWYWMRGFVESAEKQITQK